MRMVFPSQVSGRLMDDLATDVGTLVESFFGDSTDRARTESRNQLTVPMDIDESEDGYLMWLDVPGVSLESIAIDFHEDTLTISGERGLPKTSETESVEKAPSKRRRERAQGKFERKVQFPHPVEPESITAELADGVLVIKLAKADPEKGKRRIPVSKA